MTELEAQRDQSTNENTKLDERIAELTSRKNMVYHFFCFYFLYLPI